MLSFFLSWQIVSKLKDEITVMEREHNDLQLHIKRTDWWCENFGMWKAFINTSEVLTFKNLFGRRPVIAYAV